jgi:AraC-like DNA-binding protein
LPIQHPRPWHRGSEFGDGLRWPLDREQRCVWRVRLDLARRAGRITALQAQIGLALLRRLGQDGRCDPSHDTLATDAGCGPRTVRRALMALFELGMLRWINRLVRAGQRTEQTSNAYTLIVAVAAVFAPRPRRKNPCGTSDGQLGRETRSSMIQNSSSTEKASAMAALARIRLAWEEGLRQKWAAKFA